MKDLLLILASLLFGTSGRSRPSCPRRTLLALQGLEDRLTPALIVAQIPVDPVPVFLAGTTQKAVLRLVINNTGAVAQADRLLWSDQDGTQVQGAGGCDRVYGGLHIG